MATTTTTTKNKKQSNDKTNQISGNTGWRPKKKRDSSRPG